MNNEYFLNDWSFSARILDVSTEILSRAGMNPVVRQPQDESDFDIELESFGLKLGVYCKRNIRPSGVVSPPVSLTNNERIPVMGIPVGSERMQDTLRRMGWAWFDLAGNCHIMVSGRILLQILGQPQVVSRPPGKLNLSTPQSGYIMRTLLVPENVGLTWNQRKLSTKCDPMVSIGLVNKVVRELREEGFLDPGESVKVKDHEGLLDVWQKSYRFDRHQQISCFTLLNPQKIHERLAELEIEQPMVDRFAYASFSAAEFQAPNVRQPNIWLYAAVGSEKELMQKLDAKPVDSGANLRIFVSEDKGVFFKCHRAEGRLRVTNPLQTYVDLMHSGGRGAEAAEAILGQCLRPAWEKSK